ncbi:MAG: tetratricopeptide repeat protein [Planctomycetes bacterium]|nr:tetratricopeptide repeat protein [Planctomycetota bacterium]
MIAEETPARGRVLWAALLLAALTFVLYLPVGGFEFLNFDDPDYVTANPVIARGLSAEGLRWAFGFHAANWHPLTWVSLMADADRFHGASGAMHLENAGLHALGAALLFAALVALCARFWPSFVVAALFAAHPLRVQCVAWVSERKELLAAVCFFGLLLAYARYARTRGRGAYLATLALLALGLMAKPTLVTAPFVLLLLDLWPLKRTQNGATWRGLVLEKLPHLALAAGSCVLTLLAQRAGGAVGDLSQLSLLERVWSAGSGLLAYLRATLWPAELTFFYPHPLLIGQNVLATGVAGVVLALGVSALAWRSRACCPAFFSGWFWFLGMLVPVLGLVQVGDQAWADRYAYLPTIGLYVALAFGLAEAWRAHENLLVGLTLGGLAMAGALAVVSARTLPHWRDDRSLYEHALSVNDQNWLAHNNLGLVYLARRETAPAREHFAAASRVRPSFVQARYNLGLAFEAEREFGQAVQVYLSALEVHPGHPETLLRLAALARAQGNVEQARTFFEQALEKNPAHGGLWAAFARFLLEQGDLERAANLATSALKLDASLADAQVVLAEIAMRGGDAAEASQRLQSAQALSGETAELCALRGRLALQKGDVPTARKALERAVALDPSSSRARYDLGTLLLSAGEREAARSQFQAVNDIRPGDPQALIALAAIAMDEKKPEEAIRLLQDALKRLPDFPLALSNLAAAYEQTGQWAKALECYDKAFAAGTPDPDAACAAAWILATGPDEALLDGARALELATYAMQRKAANALEVLAAAQARAGDFAKAVQVQEQAVQVERSAAHKQEQSERLELYRAQKPYTRKK